jgi:hypothetical protein
VPFSVSSTSRLIGASTVDHLSTGSGVGATDRMTDKKRGDDPEKTIAAVGEGKEEAKPSDTVTRTTPGAGSGNAARKRKRNENEEDELLHRVNGLMYSDAGFTIIPSTTGYSFVCQLRYSESFRNGLFSIV